MDAHLSPQLQYTILTHELVVFNVIGTKFCLKKNLFDAHKLSLFYSFLHTNNTLPKCVIKLNEDEFFIQRSPDLFKIVILYCIYGKLHVPNTMCSDEVLDEFHFWKIDYENACTNCSSHVHLNSTSEDTSDDKSDIQTCNMRSTLWTFMQYPHSSFPALVFFILSMLVILLSILNIILSSMPELQNCPSNVTQQDKDDANKKAALDSEDDFKQTNCSGTFAFNVIDMFCMTWFSMELILRLISCPKYKKFFTSPMTIIDILSILPFYIEILFFFINTDDDSLEKAKAMLMFLRIFKLFQITRILKLARYSMNLKVLGKTFMSAKDDLWMLLVFIFIASLVFSNCVYQFEKDQTDTQFVSIPATFWWCIVTLTTVGYGDMTPETNGGKVMAGCACVCGILLIAFPIAVLVEKFQTTYNEEKKKEKTKRHRKKFFSFSSHSVSNEKESCKSYSTSEQSDESISISL